MNNILYEKIMEAFSSVLPITGIVLLASVVLTPIPSGMLLMFMVGAILLILGMGLFTMGADMSMMPIGEGIGIQLTHAAKTGAKSANPLVRALIWAGGLAAIIVISFIMGMIITIAEPDLQVLAKQVPLDIPNLPAWMSSSMVLILTVAAGVGIFLVIAVLRVVFRIPLAILLVFFYVLTFAAVFFAPPAFVPVAFDSGGVTTGPMTVPFILAMGVGVASIRADKGSQDDSFGLVSLCSIGPILAVTVLGIIFRPDSASVSSAATPDSETSQEVAFAFAEAFPDYALEVIQALGALVIFFIIFQIISKRYKIKQVKKISVGFVYTFLGLVVFLTGVNVGFIPVGHYMGSELAASPRHFEIPALSISVPLKWILVPFSMIVGYFIVSAEPAVHVLNKQVESISSGAIPQKAMMTGLSVGMAAALGLTMVRILLQVNIMYFLIPGYALSIILTFVVPKIFVGIAFDSGGVCSGPMSSTFLLPLAMGVCEGSGGDMMRDAFGIVAMVAMAPLVVIQIMGLAYKIRIARPAAVPAMTPEEAGEIIEYAL